MRIAVVHSFYSSAVPSGENRVVLEQVKALHEAGHEVLLIRRDTDALQKRFLGARTALNLIADRGFDPRPQLQSFKPDVVHVHNLFPNISSSWIPEWNGPTVVSLHNYRATCSNGYFYRDGAICTECFDFGPYRAIVHACYRNSRAATLPVALTRVRTQRELLHAASAVITTSELSDEIVRKYVSSDLPTTVIPNFGPEDIQSLDQEYQPRQFWIALGRFSAEKGFVELARDWPPEEFLILDGNGALKKKIVDVATHKRIEVRSTRDRVVLTSTLAKAIGLIFPSRWFDVDPQVVVEGMAAGLPVIAFHHNAAARIVTASGAGATYTSSESLQAALSRVRTNREVMSAKARAEYLRRWTKDAWLRKIFAVYERVTRS